MKTSMVTPYIDPGTDKFTQPDWAHAALVTVDIQQDTLDGQPAAVQGTTQILPVVRNLLDQFRNLEKPIVHIVRIYRRDARNVDQCRKSQIQSGASIFLEDSKGCQLAADLFLEAPELQSGLLLKGGIQKVTDREVIIYKPRWGAFYSTPLKTHLNTLGISTLVFTGCNFPNCPRTSIYQASERDYRIILIRDAVSGLYSRAERELEDIGVQIMESAHLMSQFNCLESDGSQ